MRHDRCVPVVFFFGAMSPYSWLSAERIGAVIPHAQWQSVFLGGMFKSNGRRSWGIGDQRDAGMAECEARARAYGLGEIAWPDPWPTNDLVVARAMLLAQARGLLVPFALGAMRMAFKEGADLAQPGVVLEAGKRVGIAPEELADALVAPETKGALRVTTEQTLARGVFGVPTFAVAEQLFWGDDRMEEAAAAAAQQAAAGAGA
jgi:2-hydroxychromene-2-carboxylate isomerase